MNHKTIKDILARDVGISAKRYLEKSLLNLLLENKDFIIELRVYIKNTISANRFVMDSISVCIHILKKQK